jgi:MFS family permease
LSPDPATADRLSPATAGGPYLAAPGGPPPLTPGGPYPAAAYAWYVVAILLLAYILAFVDREVMSLLVKSIETSLDISDTQMSLLLGGAFALLYTLLGVPIAWLADHFNRRWIVFTGVGLWSLMTCLCGFATGYWTLFAARVGVGVGEASLNPSALSLLKDYFPPARMGLAIGLYTAGVSSGSGIASVLGGALYPGLATAGPRSFPFIGTLAPWQQMFVLVGAPGFLVTILLLTVREPLRRGLGSAAGVPRALPGRSTRTPLFAGVHFALVRWRTYLVLFLANSVLAILAYGIGFWIPEFLRRTWHLDAQAYGHFVQIRGYVTIGAGLAGVLVGGWLCDRFRQRYADGYVRVCLIGFGFMTCGYCTFALMPTPQLSLLMLVPATFGAAVPTAAGVAAVVAIAPPTLRAQLTACYYFTLNFVGLFVGPTAVALVTDYYFHDPAQLRWSLTVVAALSTAAGIALLFYNLKHYRASAAEAREWA